MLLFLSDLLVGILRSSMRFASNKRICKVAELKNILIEFYSVIVHVREI